MKNIWKISGISIALGLILMIIGSLLGANRHIYADSKGIHLGDNNENSYKIEEHNMNSFKDIDINSDFSDIEFIKSDNYGIEIYYSNDSATPTWSLDNGKLKVNYNYNGLNNINFFNLDLSFNNMHNIIRVYYPESASFNSCLMKTSSGKITIDALNVKNLNITNDFGNVSINNSTINKLDSINDVVIKCKSGNITIDALNTQNLNITDDFGNVTMNNSNINKLDSLISSGKLKLKDCVIQNGNMENRFGDISGDNIKTSKLSITSNSGNVTLNGDLSGNTDLHCDFGNITLDLSKPESDYNYDMWTKFGDIRLDGKKQDGTSIKQVDSASSNELNISTQSGNIKVNFKR